MDPELTTKFARLLAVSTRMAVALGMRAGLGFDPRATDEAVGHVVVIELEGSGQVFHYVHERDLDLFAFLPPYEGTWDGHGTKERDRRLEVFSKTWQGPKKET